MYKMHLKVSQPVFFTKKLQYKIYIPPSSQTFAIMEFVDNFFIHFLLSFYVTDPVELDAKMVKRFKANDHLREKGIYKLIRRILMLDVLTVAHYRNMCNMKWYTDALYSIADEMFCFHFHKLFVLFCKKSN